MLEKKWLVILALLGLTGCAGDPKFVLEGTLTSSPHFTLRSSQGNDLHIPSGPISLIAYRDQLYLTSPSASTSIGVFSFTYPSDPLLKSETLKNIINLDSNYKILVNGADVGQNVDIWGSKTLHLLTDKSKEMEESVRCGKAGKQKILQRTTPILLRYRIEFHHRGKKDVTSNTSPVARILSDYGMAPRIETVKILSDCL